MQGLPGHWAHLTSPKASTKGPSPLRLQEQKKTSRSCTVHLLPIFYQQLTFRESFMAQNLIEVCVYIKDCNPSLDNKSETQRTRESILPPWLFFPAHPPSIGIRAKISIRSSFEMTCESNPISNCCVRFHPSSSTSSVPSIRSIV